MTNDTQATGGKGEQEMPKLAWCGVENENMHWSFHCYKPAARTFFGEGYEGNKALCCKFGISEDGDTFIPFGQIEAQELDRDAACKRCLKIYDKLQNTQP